MSSTMASKPDEHCGTDSAIDIDIEAAPHSQSDGSFTAKDFADYEERLSTCQLEQPVRAVFLPRRPNHNTPVRCTSMPVYVPTVGGFTGPEFVDYETRLGAISARPTGASEVKHSDVIAIEVKRSDTDLTATSADSGVGVLPDKRQPILIREVRHRFLNVYRRIFGLVLIANAVALLWFVVYHSSLNLPVSTMATAASANLCVAILIRQEYIINSLYALCLKVPPSAPLRLRRILAKVYENGGTHSGAAVLGTVWFTLLSIVLVYQFSTAKLIRNSVATVVVTSILLALLFLILLFAYPNLRNLKHNNFEYTHRFAGWTAVGIFWAELTLLAENSRVASNQNMWYVLVSMPTFWFLLIITMHLVMPWVLLRKVQFTAKNLSDHAVRLNFNEELAPFRGVALAKSPLGQYHSFATFPNTESPSPNGQSIVLSAAGDWTKAQVASPDTARHFWLRGMPKTGVLGMALIFKKVVLVTTGSGIGPCLAFLNLPEMLRRPCRVIWSTPNPLQVYGEGMCNMVRTADPDALIWNTKESGRPDMLMLAYDMYKRSGAEAVFVISNPHVTRKVVYGLESRNIPAYGPIWDS